MSHRIRKPGRQRAPRQSGAIGWAIVRTPGFTLLELMVVVAILGILSLIALHQFQEYRLKSFDARATTDLRNAATAEEAYFVSTQTYKSGSDTGPGPSSFLAGLIVSDTVTLSITAQGREQFTGTSKSNSGTGKVFTYDNSAGGVQ